jgi:hypothetical protein
VWKLLRHRLHPPAIRNLHVLARIY